MKLAAFPKCFMDQLVVERSMSVFDWIEMAADLPIDGLELYDGFLETLEEGYLEKVRLAIERRRLKMPMLCCSPDFIQPDPRARRKEIEREKRMIDVTASLGGRFCVFSPANAGRTFHERREFAWLWKASMKCWTTPPKGESSSPSRTITRTITGNTLNLPSTWTSSWRL